ncbi:perlucin-like [Macrobrachium nipponense]|uniref:perlucin-like n=1 Tax=Macrobrachium nipponense TaxID=159736 RepID=UPI0030C84F24
MLSPSHATFLLFVLFLLPITTSGVYDDSDKQVELQSAIMMSQLALVQHSEILAEILNTTRTQQCSSCYAEGVSNSLNSLMRLKEAAIALLERESPTTKRNGCPYPYTEVVYECFYAHPKKLAWHQARRVCQGMGGDLAEPQNVYALQTYLAETFGPSYFWVGGNSLDSGDGAWSWVSGRPIDPEDWLFLRPDNLGGDENCLEIVMSDYPKLFNDETCTVVQRFICQYRHG